MACVGSFCLACRSVWLRYSHLKTKLQSKPPLRSAEAPRNEIKLSFVQIFQIIYNMRVQIIAIHGEKWLRNFYFTRLVKFFWLFIFYEFMTNFTCLKVKISKGKKLQLYITITVNHSRDY